MGSDSSAGGFDGRRGSSRAAFVLALAFAAILALASGCGRGGHGAETDPEKGSDVGILNASLTRELTTLDAYTRGRPLLKGSERPVGRLLRAQEQEYVDALTKAIRGLGGETEAEPEELDFSRVKSQADFLALAYELESAALASYTDAAPRLYTSAPRTLDASLAAGHAQHLVVLRQGLGAGLPASIPEALDDGEVPPPGGGSPVGGR
ncbi:MAG TPA: ferritin-like domain-containing protein [Solirubrobacterales bacterium]|nr:ferritin-like domain-containing protein [Solirubrobacterales bacterium]